jgi:lipopolysaccharide transport system ATP-binding protein
MGESIIEVRDVSKEYVIGEYLGYGRISESIMNLVTHPIETIRKTRSKKETFLALRNVSFSLERGEVLGIIGRNGAGKSTLLKILSRITYPTSGEAILRGRVGSLLEVGTGFHPELTGRENIYLNGAILGMRRREIDSKLNDIIEFAEVERFIDTPVKRYSSGMYVRLAFAVAAQLEPEILLVDEVLAVGDIAFQKKCLGKMKDVSESGRTVLFVSHNMAAVQSLCTRAIVLSRGEKVFGGSQTEGVDFYQKEIYEKLSKQNLATRKDRQGSRRALIVEFWCEDAAGNVVGHLRSGDDAHFCFKVICHESIRNAWSGLMIHSNIGQNLVTCSTRQVGFEIPVLEKGENVLKCHVRHLPLISGLYTVSLDLSSVGEWVDHVSPAGEIYVEEGDFFGTGYVEKAFPFLVMQDWEVVDTTR